MRAELRELRAERRPAQLGSALVFREEWQRYEKTWVWPDKQKRLVRSLIKPVLAHFGDMPLAEMTVEEWEHYRDDVRLPMTTRLGRHPAPATLNEELKRIKAFLRDRQRRGRIAPSPLLAVQLLPVRPGRQTEIHEDGIARALEVADPFMRALILIAVDSGMRATEVRTLTWRQVDFATGRVTCYWWRSKTKKPRSARLSERALDALRALPRDLHSEYVFANPQTNKPYAHSAIWYRWRAIVVAARLEVDDPEDGTVHLHDARHTAASRLARLKVPIPTIMKLLGWRSASTARRYLHADETDLDDAQDELNRATNRKGPVTAQKNSKESNVGERGHRIVGVDHTK